jgi:drug/metabolite transporter (DMT)-like permease
LKIPVEVKNRAQSIAPKAALLAAVLIWGTSFVAGKLAYTDIGPVLLAFFRFSVAFLVLLPALIRYRHIRSLPLIPIALIGFMGVTLFYSLQNVGLYYTSAANTGLIQGSIPVFTLLFSVYLLGERFTWLRSLGVLLSVLGVVMIVLITGNDHGGTNPLLGNILVLLSAAAWAFYTVKSKPLLKKIPQQVLVAASMFFWPGISASCLDHRNEYYGLCTNQPVQLGCYLLPGAFCIRFCISLLELWLKAC